MEIDNHRVKFGAPRWARLLSDGGPIPTIEAAAGDIETFAQDGCAVRLTFQNRDPLWFCPQFGGSIHTLLNRLFETGIRYDGGRGGSRMGLCGMWVPPRRRSPPIAP